jgi:predicted ATPase/transcriptional regulator with XRE-family HTH domain
MLEQHSFGYWLRRKRKALDLTREGLAERVGCSVSTIRKLEEEERRPSDQMAKRLADIFEISPTERMTFLNFARGGWGSALNPGSEQAPWRLSAQDLTQHPRSNLPATFTSVIGREQDMVAVREYLINPNIRLVTLIGPPGIGKTRLSVESARKSLAEFPDGIFFVALAPLDHPSLIPAAIVQALGYAEKNDMPADKRIMEGIGNKRMLLLLDNCEHLIEEVAPLVSYFLSACPRLKMMATSREALRIPGEWLYSVPALGMPETDSRVNPEIISEFPALVLFAERARAVRSDFALNAENIQEVVTICAELDGLPLAIELMAARIRLMSPQTLLENLNDQFILSADGMRAVPMRLKSLNNVIAWSYHLLSSEEQELFAFLSVFSGDFSVDAAEAIFSQAIPERSVAALLTSLLDKSLLQHVVGERDRSRLTMLVTIQRFALNRLKSTGLEAAARRGHLMYFIKIAEQGDREVRGAAVIEWISRIESEHNNFRAALEWSVSDGDTEAALRLLTSLGWFWQLAGHFSEARNWLEQIRRLSGMKDHLALYARLLNHIGRVSWTQGRTEEARTLLEESQSICQGLEDAGEPILAEALNWLGLLALTSERDADEARSLIQQGLEIYHKWENHRGVALSMLNLGIVEIQSNHDDLALSFLEKSLTLSRKFGDLIIIARIARYLGNLYLKQENYEKARLFFEEHLRIDTELKFWDGIGHAYGEFGNMFRYQGDYDRAERYYKKSLKVHDDHGLEPDAQYLQCLVLTALHRKDFLLASRRIVDCYRRAGKPGEKITIYGLLMGFAALASGTNHFERAARLSGAAQAMIETTSFGYEPIDWVEFDRHIQIARDQLGEEKYEALVSEGRALMLEQAVEYALEWSASS